MTKTEIDKARFLIQISLSQHNGEEIAQDVLRVFDELEKAYEEKITKEYKPERMPQEPNTTYNNPTTTVASLGAIISF